MVALSPPLLALGQATEHPHGGRPPTEPPPTGTVSPELETFGHAVAVQARPDQLEYFHGALDSTDEALQLSRNLQRMGPAAYNISAVNAISLQLRDTLDEVEHDNRRLLASFTKAQAAGLKPLTKQLARSYKFVERDARTMQELMEPGKIVPQHLATGAANLEKALSDFRTDQVRLGREMGIQSK